MVSTFNPYFFQTFLKDGDEFFEAGCCWFDNIFLPPKLNDTNNPIML